MAEHHRWVKQSYYHLWECSECGSRCSSENDPPPDFYPDDVPGTPRDKKTYGKGMNCDQKRTSDASRVRNGHVNNVTVSIREALAGGLSIDEITSIMHVEIAKSVTEV